MILYIEQSLDGINKQTHPHLSNVTNWYKTSNGYDVLVDNVVVETKYDGNSIHYKHLRIIREDGRPIHNWKDIQQIKNDVFGSDCVAVQIFPAEKDLIDGSNTYHLWLISEHMSEMMPNLKKLYTYKNKNK